MTTYCISDCIYIIDKKYLNFELKKHNYINETLRNYSHKIKKEIDNNIKEWEKNKKYSNPYEFINTNFDSNTEPVCKYKPLSRSFFKLIEILNSFTFLNFNKHKINSFHLAEGPGGFIEALSYFRNNPNDIYYGITLIENKKHIPKWKSYDNYLTIHKNIKFEYGVDKTGNLLNKQNLLYIYKLYHNSIDFVTGDGGFDFSDDFNKQEEISLNLIFSQILYAICIQKKGGHFVLKLFDTFTCLSLDLLYLLNYLYEDVYFIKPHTSRPGNSEKYIVCKNFLMLDNTKFIINYLIENFHYIVQNKVTRIFNFTIPQYFKDKIEEINSIFGQTQIEHIQSVLIYILDSNKKVNLENLKKSHFIKCSKWCKKNNLPY